MIRIRHLRLLGSSRNYDVSFVSNDRLRALALITGEISTGKTSILDFIDYCFGAKSHPAQVEVQRQVLAAQLEVELDGELVVLERSLFSQDKFVSLHRCALDGIDKPHETSRLPVGPASDARSLNWMLLRSSGLEGVVLKEAPSQAASETDALSFRDVMWLSYLHTDRLIAGHLLHEPKPMKRLKLRQLIEVIFGVHDQQLAAMGDRIKLLEDERMRQQHEIDALRTFLYEQEIHDRLTLESEHARRSRRLRELQSELSRIELDMQATTDFAEAARARYGAARRRAGELTARVRDRESLLRRLLPLRGQYAEDERKLVFFSEARRLFDPLAVTVCPSCLQALADAPRIVEERCTLCHQHLESLEDNISIDVEAERAAIRIRLRSLDSYVTDVERDLDVHRSELVVASEEEAGAQAQLDSDLAERLSPYVAERDRLVRTIESERGRKRDLKRQIGWWDAIARRTADLATLNDRLEQLREQQRRLEAGRPSRDAVVGRLSARFEDLLRQFGFPKLDDPKEPYLNERLEPHVRGVPYAELRSRGATTLVALAWQLAIFELAVEEGAPHPGFLLLDSPQTGLKPMAAQVRDEFTGFEIPERVWQHLLKWSAGPGADAQLIVVDHRPPHIVDSGLIAVEYSGEPERPPYGLIDNETGADEVPTPS